MKTCFVIFPLVLVFGVTVGLVREHIFIKNQMKWKEAQNHCRQNYEDLSTITSGEEKNMIINVIAPSSSESWIGLQRSTEDPSKWIWSDKEDLSPFSSFFTWKSGYPWWSSGDCVLMDDAGKIRNVNCGEQHAFYCERILVLVKENKTWEEAYEYCRAHYTSLAFLSSQIQLDLAKQETSGAQTVSVWTGLRFLAGEWSWVNGKPLGSLVSLPSCPTQPYRCGARNSKMDSWENRDCEEKLNFLCYG